jgi:hypothetical protein
MWVLDLPRSLQAFCYWLLAAFVPAGYSLLAAFWPPAANFQLAENVVASIIRAANRVGVRLIVDSPLLAIDGVRART